MLRSPTLLFRYGVPILSTFVAAVTSLVFYPVLAATPSVLFIGAVSLSAWYGGLGPGLLATVIGAVVFDYMSIDSPYSFSLSSPVSALYLVGFVLVELLITGLTAALRNDVARRKVAEEELHKLTAELEARATEAEAGYQELLLLHEVGQAVLGTMDLPALCDQFLAGAMRVGQYDLGLLRLARKDGALEVVATRGYDDPSNLPPLIQPTAQRSLQTITGRVPVVVEDVPASGMYPRLEKERIASLVLVPILADGEPLGLLLLASRSPHHFKENEVRLLDAVASQAGIALQKARLFAETAQAYAELQQAEAGRSRLVSILEATTSDLTTSLSLLEGTLEATADGILVVDGDGTILRFNQKFQDMWQIPPSTIAGQANVEQIRFALNQLVEPDAFQARVDEVSSDPDTESFDTIEFKDRRVYEVHSRAKRIENRRPVRVWSFRDVTSRREIELRLLRAQRLETAGRIAGQVAHDFNNLLAPLVGFPELIRLQLPEGHRGIEYCDLMVQAAEQIAQINEDLLTLGRRGHFNQVSVDLNDLVRQTLGQLGPTPVTLVMDVQLAHDSLSVYGAPAQLGRMILNLAANAREAMQDIGTLTIRTSNAYLDQPTGCVTKVPVGEYVLLEVIDSGPGIPDDVRDHIFDAFFTTKPVGRRRGAGLGLSVVQAVADDHRAYLDVQSEPGRGSTFCVYLPVAREAAIRDTIAEVSGGTESILVVDDDPFQRAVAQELLESLGYRVTLATSGELALANAQTERFDLMVLDMVMPPGMDGAETYRRVLTERPGQRAILLSGFAESERVAVAQRLGAGAFVRKPVTRERLAAAVRSELDRPAAVAS